MRQHRSECRCRRAFHQRLFDFQNQRESMFDRCFAHHQKIAH